MMMMINSSRTRRLVVVVMVTVMGARLVVFALEAFGVMSWGGPGAERQLDVAAHAPDADNRRDDASWAQG
jgi:hypothetical protein